MWHFGGVTMDFSGVKWHFRSRKHTLFRCRTYTFPAENIHADGGKHAMGSLQAGFHPTEKPHSAPFFFLFQALYKRHVSAKKSIRQPFADIQPQSATLCPLLKQHSSPALPPLFRPRACFFQKKSVSWTKEKTAYGPT